MVCKMEHDQIEDMDTEVLHSMWPEDVGPDVSKQFNVENPGGDQDMLEEVTIVEEPSIVDFKRLLELTNYTDQGSSQLAYLVKHWEYKQATAVRLLREELDILSKQRQEVELKKLEILEEHRFEEESNGCDKRPVSILEDVYDIYEDVPRRKKDAVVQSKRVEIAAEYGTIVYWKQRALHSEKLLEAGTQREQALQEKLQESIKNLERQSSPVEELSQILKRADNFLHFVLRNAPVVIGHQDKELRYCFIYNHFPSLQEEDILGKTDMEIFTGPGVKESQEFKKEVLDKGKPAKREIKFDTELFGSKTFLIYVEPVFSKAGETIGINYMGMDVTDQVRKREKMMKVREEIAVQRAKETEMNKTIHITEETMRAKQMLATMSHEIRSPLAGVVSMADILSNTILDREQRQLLNVMISSGDLVLQLINDILDLSKVESGVMRLEATKFRPREVVQHVLQTAAASLQKILTLEGHVADDVPIEVIGDVLRIRQILTNLISNAVKFTHEGKVGIKLYLVPEPPFAKEGSQSTPNIPQEENSSLTLQLSSDEKGLSGQNHDECPCQIHLLSDSSMDGDKEEQHESTETTVWIRCDVYDSGIGIPENGLPTIFKKYMQVSVDHARKYGGTGLGLAICKQLVELMGGRLTVTSRVHNGSTFTFILPYKVSSTSDNSDDPDELLDMADHDAATDDITAGFFQFHPSNLGSLFSSNGSTRTQQLSSNNIGYNSSNNLNGFSEDSYSFPSDDVRPKETALLEDASSTVEVAETISEPESSFSSSQHTNNENVVCRGKEIKDDGENHVKISSTDPGSHSESSREMGLMAKTREPPGSCQSTASSSPEEKSKLKPKILLVEDDKINIMVTQAMMKQLGHTIDVVNNGVEAVRAVQCHTYDLILMDVCMPVMDGLQATRLIRSFEETGSWDSAVKAGIEQSVLSSDSIQQSKGSIPSTRRMPIIAMTANALSESEDECFANGMDSFVSKPVTFQKLKECLGQYLT
ncbi:Response_reg domain-containing protein/HisKA domain-containing protein/HATPase_c domain-containing protein [Cephalotus follicularis]|uniref:histidine kinase n=1 Tax=Cephalotus follicularis TaxID=3775 RepID=A0A1Q3CCI3_CEPFO|nr:Response_reg domain-containing protein/HisKA domain-containing protein/HATPase_c domain-containing protein [Cephalotus follicularis]